MNISSTTLRNLQIEGFEGDYVFETIKKSQNFYEFSILAKWLPYIQNSKIVFDIGANLGNHTLFFATHIVCERLYSFEPYLPTFQRLVHNIENNNLHMAHPVNKAVGSRSGFTTLKSTDNANLGATTLEKELKDDGDIEVVDVDSFVTDNQLTSVDFIKIDTEGGEENVIAGMQITLAQFHPDLWVEASSSTYEYILHTLKKHDYILVDVMGFNLLLLHPSRHDQLAELHSSVILSALFNSMEKADKYYKHYETAKKWIENKDQKLQNMNETHAALDAKYQTAVENYAKIKDRLSAKEQAIDNANNTIQTLSTDKLELIKQNQALQLQKEELERSCKLTISQLQEQLEIAERNCKDSNELLHSFTQDEHQTQLVLQKAQRLIQKQQAEMQLMRVDVDNYRRLVHKITDPWYGRLLLKCYRLLQKFNILK